MQNKHTNNIIKSVLPQVPESYRARMEDTLAALPVDSVRPVTVRGFTKKQIIILVAALITLLTLGTALAVTISRMQEVRDGGLDKINTYEKFVNDSLPAGETLPDNSVDSNCTVPLGIGMSDEFISKIFTPFERERNTTISGIQGTGLGMSIVKGLVEMMGGQISITSKIKEGTEVTISLDFRVSGESKKARKDIDEFDDETETEQNLTGKKILLVEDNAINCEIAKTLLEEQGFIVDNAENGAEAVEIMSKSKKDDFDVILMDIQMPVMDGYTAAKKIRSLPDKDVSSIPIIATTANAFAEDIRHALEVGMDAHISKPISIEKVIDVIGKVCK